VKHLMVILAVASLVLAAGGMAPAAVISWTKGDIDGVGGQGDLAVSTAGTLIEAANFGPAGVPALSTVNTVPFTGINFAGGGSPTNLSGLTYNDGTGGLGTSTGGTIDTLTDAIAFQSGIDPQSGALTGLTIGKTYETQFFLAHSGVGRTLTITAGDPVTLKTRSPAQYASGTFTADATTQAITFDANTGSQFMNAYQLREIAPLPPAEGLQVQFKQSASAMDQAGWTQITGGSPPLTATISGGEFDGVGISGNGTHVRSHPHDANYVLVNHTDGYLDSLLSGGVLTNDSGSNITLTLTGLADGEYSITTYHHTPWLLGDESDFDVLLTDATVTNSLIHDDVPLSYGKTVTTAGLAALVTDFAVSGGSTTTLVFAPASGFDGRDHLNLNGFELRSAAIIPEPSSFILAALGLLGLGWYGWRRRQRAA